jgi:hypothetical protein
MKDILKLKLDKLIFLNFSNNIIIIRMLVIAIKYFEVFIRRIYFSIVFSSIVRNLFLNRCKNRITIKINSHF